MAARRLKHGEPVLAILIRGDEYNVYLHSEKEVHSLCSNAEAFMNFEKKEIRFSEENISTCTILHELTHCFIASTYIHEVESHIDLGTFEEIVCEVVSRNYVLMGEMAKMVKLTLETELERRRENGKRKTKKG